MAEEVQFQVLDNPPDAAINWDPAVGEESRAVVERTLEDEGSRRSLLQTSRDILSQCANPSEDQEPGTGLVVGYVQSGKTLSFTTVAAMANDNQYRIIVVIAGVTRDLADQSQGRLVRDLGIEETPFSRWEQFHNPVLDDVPRIRDVLAEWDDSSVRQEERRTVLITVLKHHRRLRALNEVIDQLGEATHGPALVIDDEADQASLNNLVREGALSTTYWRLRQLRDSLPHHTFLQYTATPQALLLINLIDVLSPDFPVVLAPGEDYVGGLTFFESNSPYVVGIPGDEIPTLDQPLVEPPDSLLRALRMFFVGVVSGLIRRGNQPRNRSMMVHPSRETIGHVQYFTWVQAIRNLWMDILSAPPEDPDRQELLEEFQEDYANLATTVEDLEDFETIAGSLLHAVRRTEVRLVNSLGQANREIHWRRVYSWILVGGQVLDRGFTVEGLTVSYMPRGPGVGNADTIQQRARFMGYKRPYLGYCRVFLEPTVGEAYRVYVRHEEDVRERLEEHIASGRPLSELRRVFLLDRTLRPTRDTILDIDYYRPTFRNGWCVARSPHEANVDHNRRHVAAFMRENRDRFERDQGHPERRDHQLHRLARDLSLAAVYEGLLTRLETRDFEDSQRWTFALIMINRFLGHNPEATCSVYEMRPDVPTRRQVRDGRILNLFQGAYPDARGEIYPGDRRLRQGDVTIQIHGVTLVEGATATSPILAQDVKIAAIWMFANVLQDIIVQPQGD